MPMDAVVSDFLSGAAEMLSPDAAGRSLGRDRRPGLAVSSGLRRRLARPAARQPARRVRGLPRSRRARRSSALPGLPVPSLEELIDLTVTLGRRANPAIRCGGHLAQHLGAVAEPKPRPRLPAPTERAEAARRRSAARRGGVRAPGRFLPRLTWPAKRAGDRPSWFQRYLLPGLAFKALVIGGGYATGREVAEFFLPSGPWGGLAAIALATVLFSAGCALTFLFALATRSLDYQSFFKALLGPRLGRLGGHLHPVRDPDPRRLRRGGGRDRRGAVRPADAWPARSC